MWVEQWSTSKQKPYYLNVITKEKSWSCPNGASIASSYDSVAESKQNIKERALQRAILHNQVKGMGLSAAMGSRTDLQVLDVCCGKGGDLLKWVKSGRVNTLHGFDISEESIVEANQRAQAHAGTVHVEYRCHDGRKNDSWGTQKYDVISCQFAIHYFFSSQPLATHFFKQCAHVARPGTTLVITYVNAHELSGHLWESEQKHINYFIPLPSFCYVSTVIPAPKNGPVPYMFHLDGSVETLAEYTVPQQILHKLLKKWKFNVVTDEPFVEYGRKHCMCVPSTEEGFAVSKLYNILIAVST